MTYKLDRDKYDSQRLILAVDLVIYQGISPL